MKSRSFFTTSTLLLIILSSFESNVVIGVIDPIYQWNLLEIGTEKAWNYSKGDSNIIVAVIDSGVDFTHPDLIGQSWLNLGEIPNNEKDDDNNGYVDDIKGWDFRDNDNDPSPGHIHGTFISGLIAADDDNNLSVGVAPNIRVMAIRFLKDDLSWDGEDWPLFIEAIDYAINNNADVIHLSMQAYGIPPNSFHEAIKRAYQNEIPIVSVTGNIINGLDHVRYPGNYSEVIAVSATDKDHKLAYFSCFGSENEICAPGEDVYSIEPNNNELVLGSGTSYAAPLVTGAIALMLSLNNNLSIHMIRNILHTTCTDLGSIGKDNKFGYGLLNISAALEYILINYQNSTMINTSTSTTIDSVFGFEVISVLSGFILATIIWSRRKLFK